jgi:hypothetical protein
MKTIYLIFFIVILGLVKAQAKDIFVATTGSDATGTGKIDAPYLTIQKAASVAVAGDVVQVRAGLYRETITPKNSGTAGNPIIFQPYNGEEVTISGAEEITGWIVYSGNIYQAALPANFMEPEHNQSDQVFVDGEMASLAKWPNNTSPNPSQPAKSKITKFTSKSRAGNVTTIVFEDSALPTGDYADAEIYIQPNVNAWSWTFSAKVTSVSGKSITVNSFNDSGKDGNSAVIPVNSRYYIFNKLSLLDSPGEWFHDKITNLLYLWSPDNADPTSKKVEAKKREYAFDLSNKSYIEIKNIKLFACTITTDRDAGGNNKGYDASGNIIYPWRGGNSVASAKGCIIDGIQAKYLSHYSDVSGHFMFQWGQSSGIVLSGHDHIIRNSVLQYSAGNGITLLGYNCKALNNQISDMDYLSTDCSGINTGGVAPSFDHEIGYNSIVRTGRSGMTPRMLKNSNTKNLIARIHHNDISEFMLQDWDGGGIYSAGESNFVRIDHNTIHDGTGYTVGGIYFDWAKNYVIDHNVIYNVEWGIHLQESFNGTGVNNHICYNNTVVVYKTSYDYGPFCFGSSGPAKSQTGTVCQNNILVYRKDNSTTASSGFRTFSDAFGNATKVTNLEQPINPLFADWNAKNLQLQSTSPAIDAGTLMTTTTLDGVNVPAYNDVVFGSKTDIGAYEYGQPAWRAGYNTDFGIADNVPPTAPSQLMAFDITTTSFTLSWTPATDNIGIYGYDVLKDGTLVGSVTSLTSLEITGLTLNTSYSMTVTAKDAAGNTKTSEALTVKTLADEIVVTTIWDNFDTYSVASLPVSATSSTLNGGVGWKSGQGWYAVTGSTIAANSLTTSGYDNSGKRLSISGCNGAATRVMASVQGLSLTWISFKVHVTDISSINNYIVFKNGTAQNFEVNCSNPEEGWRFHYDTPAVTSPKASTTDFLTFYLLVNPDDPTTVLKGWINITSDPSATIPDMTGSGMVLPMDVSFDRIVLSACGGGYDFDDLRIGATWSDVDQSIPTGVMAQNKLDGIFVYAKNDNIIVDLSDVTGASTISVFDARGVILKAVKSSGPQESIRVYKNGIYLVRVQNSAKQYVQKVVIL